MKRTIVLAACLAALSLCISCSKVTSSSAAKSEEDEQRIIAQNEVTAMETARSMIASQISYVTTFPKSGYAADLAKLGPGAPPVDCAKEAKPDSAHACLVDKDLGCSSQWCEKTGYKYSMVGTCAAKKPCSDFVVVATPVSIHTGRKSVCASSDGIIRAKAVDPLSSPITIRECGIWPAV